MGDGAIRIFPSLCICVRTIWNFDICIEGVESLRPPSPTRLDGNLVGIWESGSSRSKVVGPPFPWDFIAISLMCIIKSTYTTSLHHFKTSLRFKVFSSGKKSSPLFS